LGFPFSDDKRPYPEALPLVPQFRIRYFHIEGMRQFLVQTIDSLLYAVCPYTIIFINDY
jgi:hypothetical protein